MPHLRFRGVAIETLLAISTPLVDELSGKLACPRDYFILECIESQFVFDGQLGAGQWPFVEVLWFDRGAEAMKAVAQMITAQLAQHYEGDITVCFHQLEAQHYFENGEHF